jgi:hypothetical protein
MIPDKLLPTTFYLVYENKSTKEQKEFLPKDLPWQDTVWMKEWAFLKQKVNDPNKYPAPNFRILDTAGVDQTILYMKQPGYLVFLVCVDVNKVGDDDLKKLNDFNNGLYEAGYTVLGLTSSTFEDLNKVNQRNNLSIKWFQSDDTELKTMVRSNPGVVLLKDATIMNKWHFRNIPSVTDLIKSYPNK